MYLSKFWNLFVLILKCICPNFKMYLFNLVGASCLATSLPGTLQNQFSHLGSCPPPIYAMHTINIYPPEARHRYLIKIKFLCTVYNYVLVQMYTYMSGLLSCLQDNPYITNWWYLALPLCYDQWDVRCVSAVTLGLHSEQILNYWRIIGHNCNSQLYQCTMMQWCNETATVDYTSLRTRGPLLWLSCN